MNILVTGASGFIGRNLLLRAPAGWRILAVYNTDISFPDFAAGIGRTDITAARCDLTDAAATAALFAEHGSEWDGCVCLGARVDIPWSVREPAADLYANAGSLLNLLGSVRCGRFVYFSSGAVYDGLQGRASAATPLSPTLPYAISKLACEQYVRCFHERKRTLDKYLIVRFFGAYGPYEAPHKIYTRLVRAFALEGRDSYTIYGSGKNLIDAMYVEDAIDAIVRMMTGEHWNDTLDLASGHPLTIEQLVSQAAEALGVGPVRVLKDGVANEDIHFMADTDTMKGRFGFEATTPLASGIPKLRDFLLNQQAVTSAHQ